MFLLKRLSFLLSCLVINPAFCDDGDLFAQIERTRAACVGLSDELSDLKKMAGINTAVTAVGTVAGGVALGTGLAKSGVDKQADKLEKELQEMLDKMALESSRQGTDFDLIPEEVMQNATRIFSSNAAIVSYASQNNSEIAAKQAELDKLTKKSKTLGNIRTGTLAGAAVADTAGTIIALNNRVDGDLQTQIDACILEKQNLSRAHAQARIEGSVDEQTLSYAENIVRACGAWEMVDLGKINSKSTGAAISSGAGAAMAIAGVITSVSANSDGVRNNNTESGKKKEKNLNTASNVLAGGTTVASGVATVFNATQIGAVKRAVSAAEECEGAFNK